MKHVLIVEAEAAWRTRIKRLLDGVAVVMAAADFRTGREWLERVRPDVLIANVRLGDYNGIHLAMLAERTQTTSVVYANAHDVGVARDVQQAGAFYEQYEALPFVLPGYLRGMLPALDRRDPSKYGRRRVRTDGRRATDKP
jgi:DNA-binding NtrC family response regulator